MDIKTLSEYALSHQSSDIHVSSGMPPALRVHGDIVYMNVPRLTAETALALMHSIMTDQQKEIYARDKELDFAIALDESTRYRVNAFSTLRGPAMVMRTIPTVIKSLQELECPKVFETLTTFPKGLILVTGPTGSGKSTTLAAMLHQINLFESKHIITIEDPIEFVHNPKKSLINQREVGANTKGFTEALRSALREDPDVILVGELRDHLTISLALTAAETGHLVLGTLHTSSAAKTIDRIIDVFSGQDKEMIRAMLSSSLQAVISQRLLKRADNSGRVAAYEILMATSAIRNLIRENKIPQIYSMMQVGARQGMITMDNYINGLLEKGVINKAEAKSIVEKDEEREQKVQQKSTKEVTLMSSDDLTFS
jgi:twitching motility protein PilT